MPTQDVTRPPWHPGRPLWARLPAEAAIHCREDYEERAAVFEYDADLPRADAEAKAYALVLDRYGARAATSPVPDAARRTLPAATPAGSAAVNGGERGRRE